MAAIAFCIKHVSSFLALACYCRVSLHALNEAPHRLLYLSIDIAVPIVRFPILSFGSAFCISSSHKAFEKAIYLSVYRNTHYTHLTPRCTLIWRTGEISLHACMSCRCRDDLLSSLYNLIPYLLSSCVLFTLHMHVMNDDKNFVIH